ncbi:hypothetical protein ONZ45_g5175 [Pleurotus djamor]|nr:hypothetical protein ONZ45_g5175 [Pleurotus djamor]
MKEFTAAKEDIRLQWEAIISALQRSLGFSRDYIRLCQSLQSGYRLATTAPAFAILVFSQQIQGEFGPLYTQYSDKIQFFKCAIAGSCGDAPTVNSARPLLPNLTGATRAAIRSLTESLAELRFVSLFWDDHHRLLMQLSQSLETFQDLVSNGFFSKELRKWGHYHDVLAQSISSISSSCDALVVKPPSPTFQAHWKRRLRLDRVLKATKKTDKQAESHSPLPQNAPKISEDQSDPLSYPHDLDAVINKTIIVQACIQAFYTRPKPLRHLVQRNREKSVQALLVQALLVQAHRYVSSLEGMIAVVRSISAIHQKMIVSPTRNAQDSRLLTDVASNLLRNSIDEYETISREIQEIEEGKNPTGNLPSTDGPDELRKHLSVHISEGELFAHLRTNFVQLVGHLHEYRRFLVSLSREFQAARHFQRTVSDPEVVNRWKSHEHQLQEYELELKWGQGLKEQKRHFGMNTRSRTALSGAVHYNS